MSDNAMWCTLVLGIVGLLLATIVAGMAIYAYRDCRYIEAGYTRQALPGCSWPEWVKGNPPVNATEPEK